MTVIDDAAHEGINSIKGQGPWAVLAVALILVILTPIGYVGYKVLPAITEFVKTSTATTEQNAENMAKLAASMSSVHEAHASMMSSITETQLAVVANGDQIAISVESVQKMLTMMTEAYDMMKQVPAQRAEQTVLLKEIEQGIQDLNAKLAEQAMRDPG